MGARRHNENRQIAGSGRWMGRGGPSVCLNLQQLLSKTGIYLLQIEIFLSTHPQQSRSVTASPTFDPYLLQIETNQTRLPENLNL